MHLFQIKNSKKNKNAIIGATDNGYYQNLKIKFQFNKIYLQSKSYSRNIYNILKYLCYKYKNNFSNIKRKHWGVYFEVRGKKSTNIQINVSVILI